MAEDRNKIDFIFIPIPLWVTYSGLPEKIGSGPWNVFRRLLELRQRFSSSTFFYPQDSLRTTCGFKSIRSLHNILATLVEEKLILWTPGRGRGNATEFTIIEPLRTPLSEEEVYQKHPRLRPRGYEETNSEPQNKKVQNLHLSEEEKVQKMHLLQEQKVQKMHLLGGQKVQNLHPNKNDCKKDNNKSDLYPKNEENNPVVVLLDRLKKLRLSKKLIVEYMEKYPASYLEEKIEIIEFRMSKDKRIKNSGGMLRRAIEEGWQPPEALAAAKEKRRQEIAKHERLQAEEKKAAIKQAKDRAVEEWIANAPGELVAEIQERAAREIREENPGAKTKFSSMLNKIRAREIIAREYLDIEELSQEN